MIVSPTQIVSVHTARGVQLHQFLASEQIDMRWTRDLREVSRCEMTVVPVLDSSRMPDLIPWLHWVSVFDDTGQDLLWTGPIQKVESGRNSMKISARDMAALFTRTRCPISKKWDVADPADIAADLLAAMIEHHGLQTRAIVRHDPLGDRFDYQAAADTGMLDTNISDLVTVGLYWSVVAGTPVLGPAPRTAVSSLGEDDFIGDGMVIVRDGATMTNDVLLRSTDNLARARVAAGGLSLQTIVDIESMFGVSNTSRAAQQYVRHRGVVRDTVTLPAGAVLHPLAPVYIDQLIPSARFGIEAYGILTLMELSSVEVFTANGQSTVAVTLEAVDDELPELVEIVEAGEKTQ